MLTSFENIPLIGVTAPSGSGKTTLLTAVFPCLKKMGLRIGAVKHTHHSFEIDQPGKDSYRLRQAGADQMLLGSAERWALIVEHGDDPAAEPGLTELLSKLDTSKLDVIFVEGFKLEQLPKIEIHRLELGEYSLAENATNIIAVASNDRKLRLPDIPVLDIDNPQQVSDFVLKYVDNVRGFRHDKTHA